VSQMNAGPSKLKIESDGTPHGTKVLLDGQDIRLPITDVQIEVNRNGAHAILTVAVPELDIQLDEEQVHWILQRPPKPREQPRFLGGEKS
jgi:hypothetical protein